MAADVRIYEYNGAGPTTTNITSGNSRFCTADVSSPSPSTDYPLNKPTVGNTNYSYKKTYALYAYSLPTGTINNVRWYTDGAYPSGWTGVTARARTSAGNSYSQATGQQGITGNVMNPAGTSIVSLTNASPLLVGGSVDNTGSPRKISDYVEVQAWIDSSVAAGTLANPMNINWSYDEI